MLRRSGADIELVDKSKPSVQYFKVENGSVPTLLIRALDGRADTLTVDVSYGPITLAEGLVFQGGSGTKTLDTLVLRGTAGVDMFQLQTNLAMVMVGNDALSVSFSDVERARFEGVDGDDTYAVSALPIPLTVNDTAGVDAVDFSGAAAGVNFSLGSSSGQKIFGGALALTVKGTFENAVGTAYADTIKGSLKANVLRGLAGKRHPARRLRRRYPLRRRQRRLALRRFRRRHPLRRIGQ